MILLNVKRIIKAFVFSVSNVIEGLLAHLDRNGEKIYADAQSVRRSRDQAFPHLFVILK